MQTVTERLYKTEEGEIVREGDPAARWLFATPGDELDDDVVLPAPGEAKPEPETPAETAEPESEAEEPAEVPTEEPAPENTEEPSGLQVRRAKKG